MKDVLIIAHFCDDFNVKGNNRFNYIADLLTKEGFDVELVTSDFSHNKKEKRTLPNEDMYKYKITYISEPIYKKNVCLKRFYSHYVMGVNLRKYLYKRKKPDVIYCAVPSIDVSCVASRYAKTNDIKFVIDVQDIWPEAFKMVLNIPVISNLIFYPMNKKANYVYGLADEIIAVSQTYADRALNVNKKLKKGYSVFLGTELATFDSFAKNNKINKPENEIWIAYAGTLGHSYDLTCVIDALGILKKQEISNLKFVVMGDGPLKQRFMKYSEEKEVYCEFTGRLDYPIMVGILTSSDITVNPITHGAVQSIINKHGDYAASGLPVINTQEGLEYKNLVVDYNIGFNCENSNSGDVAEKLLILYKNEKLRLEMGENHRKLAEEKFDRARTYERIVGILKK